MVDVEDSHWTACLHSASDLLGFAITSACISVLLAEQGDGFRDSFLFLRRQIALLIFQQLFTLGVGWDFEVSALLTSIPNHRILKEKICPCGCVGGVRLWVWSVLSLLEISLVSQKSGVSGPSLEPTLC